MKLYVIGGLGADERVFQYLDLKYETRVLKWIEPKSLESLASYAGRLAGQIDFDEKFGLLGVSFGGIIAVEIAKIRQPEKLILISSVDSSARLPIITSVTRKLRLLSFFPTKLMKPPVMLLSYLFGTQNINLLKEIIADTKPTFVKWALSQIVTWKSTAKIENVYRIHGKNDWLIPVKGLVDKILPGGHFIIVDEAKEISETLNNMDIFS